MSSPESDDPPLDALRELALSAADADPSERPRLLETARSLDEPLIVVVGALDPADDEEASHLAERLRQILPSVRLEFCRSERLVRRRPAASVLVLRPDPGDREARERLRQLRQAGLSPATAVGVAADGGPATAPSPAVAATVLTVLSAPAGDEQQLAAAIVDWFVDRADPLRAANAVVVIGSAFGQRESDNGTVAEIADRLEGLELSSPALRDLAALSGVLAQRLTVPIRLIEEATRLLGHSDTHQRLGLPPDATAAEVREHCIASAERWRRLLVEGQVPLAIRDPATHILSTYDRLGPAAGLVHARPGGQQPRTDPRVGSRLGPYLIEQQLGRGGMGVVYRAIQPRPRRRVALKLLAASFSSDEDFRLRFERESDVAAAIAHPNIVPIFEAGESEGILYLVMHYVVGSDLNTLLADTRRLDPERALHLLGQVAAALDAAHENGLVHRDVKPGNILVCSGAGGESRDHVYLTDFGLTRRVDSTSRITKSGNFLGTPEYVAPEQVEGHRVDAAADQYSLACVLFECLAGTTPFAREIEWAVLNAHVHEPPPSLSELHPELGSAIDAVIAQGMSKRPEERYGSCSELILEARKALVSRPAGDRRARPR